MKKKTTGNLPVCYAIPGLGVTSDVFSRLSEYLELKLVNWIMPESGESLEKYAGRMAAFIPQDAEVLVGYSFGGVVAQEIQKTRPDLAIILINTLVDKSEKPLWLRMMKIVPFYRLARGSWRIKLLPIYGRRYGLTTREDIAVLQKMFSESPDALRMWSIQALIKWKGENLSNKKLLRLHGSRDKVFPLTHMKSEGQWIENGRHFMIWQRAEEVAEEIKQWLLNPS